MNGTLLPVHSAIVNMGGAADVEIAGSQIGFVKSGIHWQVYAVGPGATYPFVLFREGHRILGFTNPESLTNFFKGIEHEKAEAETETAEKA